jgi:hypothetical protein
MQRRVLFAALVFLGACGDQGPGPADFSGLWQLTSINTQPLPSSGTTTNGVWGAAVLQIQGQTGVFDRCVVNPSTSTGTSQSTFVATAPLPGDRLAVQYSERRDTSADTASMNGTHLTIHYRQVQVGGQVLATDTLTFDPLAGELPQACSLTQ